MGIASNLYRRKTDPTMSTPKPDPRGAALRIINGPLGIAVFLIVSLWWLKTNEVSLEIRNHRCETFLPIVEFPVNVPGLALPADEIPDGEYGVMRLPPFAFTFDATNKHISYLSVYGLRYAYRLPADSVQLTLDGAVLNGKKTDINLGNTKFHTLDILCR